MSSKINIREGIEKDFPKVLRLIKDLATFEKQSEGVTNTLEQMKNEKNYFKCLVVENDQKEVIAIALYFFAYFTWVGKSLYLDDLFVQEKYRGKGIGKKLLQEIFAIAQKEGCKRVRWQVLHWNTPAKEFYLKMGAEVSSEWENCDFDTEFIKKFTI